MLFFFWGGGNVYNVMLYNGATLRVLTSFIFTKFPLGGRGSIASSRPSIYTDVN